MSLYLIDTNVLVYAEGASDPGKKRRAVEVLRVTASQNRGVLPAQVLAEFANTALRKLSLPAPTIQARLAEYEAVFPTLPLTAAVVLEAARGVGEHHFSYYDAQIWAAAKLNGIANVLSEDFNAGGTVEGVLFLNPFAPEFNSGEL